MNNTYTIIEGHLLDVAKQIADDSVHCVVTSPPYYGLRSYKTNPQVWLSSEQVRSLPATAHSPVWR